MNDIEILEKLKEKARNRELGIDSINYYYALAHALEQLKAGTDMNPGYMPLINEWGNSKTVPNDVQITK